MSLYLEQIRQLIALQHVDDAINEALSEKEAAPKKVDELEKLFRLQDSERQKKIERIEIIQVQLNRLLGEIQDDEARLNGYKDKISIIENNRDYQALMRDTEGLERQIQVKENERMSYIEERTKLEDALGAIEKKWTKLDKDLAEQKENLEVRLQEMDKKIQDLENLRKEHCESIPAPILKRYEFIRNRLPNPVIVHVSNGVCSGCHIAVPPQLYIDLQRGSTIMSCPNCQRLIYWDNHFPEESAQAALPKKEDNSTAPESENESVEEK